MLIRSNNKYILTFLYNTPLHELIERSIPGYLTLARVAVIFANGCNRPVKLRYIRAGLETSRGENPQLISTPSPQASISSLGAHRCGAVIISITSCKFTRVSHRQPRFPTAISINHTMDKWNRE